MTGERLLGGKELNRENLEKLIRNQIGVEKDLLRVVHGKDRAGVGKVTLSDGRIEAYETVLRMMGLEAADE